ncbi:hypothetical protein AAFF_G00279190 [Aldrovandia affinis]|uniref:Uncharacterized protein n=1 Tax=Aldrovandia affinis TaxID=143900 RepID=A0AAD7SRB7_9TELE|nr:hypothetical protein AAFF_G00279190 [Aldrovandia affinis]
MRRETLLVQRAGTVGFSEEEGDSPATIRASGGERNLWKIWTQGIENFPVKSGRDGCGSDGEMAEMDLSLHYRPSVTVTQVNQFNPSKDKPSECVPESLWRQQTNQWGAGRTSWATEEGVVYSRLGCLKLRPQGQVWPWTPPQPALPHWTYEYESQSDSDADRPEPDVVLDDLASRRFRSPSPVAPANYALPMSPVGAMAAARLHRQQVTSCHAQQQSLAYLSSTSPSPPSGRVRVASEDVALRDLYEASEDEEEEGEVGYADPVQDDLYSRKVGLSLQPSKNVAYDKFLPKFWTPEEDAHVQKIKLGSQRRPWYRKMQGFSRKRSGSSSEDSDCDPPRALPKKCPGSDERVYFPVQECGPEPLWPVVTPRWPCLCVALLARSLLNADTYDGLDSSAGIQTKWGGVGPG